jgi:hypothetical protein
MSAKKIDMSDKYNGDASVSNVSMPLALSGR